LTQWLCGCGQWEQHTHSSGGFNLLIRNARKINQRRQLDPSRFKRNGVSKI